MRVSTAFNTMLGLSAATVTGWRIIPVGVVVTLHGRAKKLRYPVLGCTHHQGGVQPGTSPG